MSDLRRLLMEGQADLGRVGAVTAAKGKLPPFVVVDSAGVEVEPVTRYLRDLALSDMSPLTSRSYGYDLLRWFSPINCTMSLIFSQVDRLASQGA
ncbi:hypothetical protein [Nonomuraea sp. NPDC052265]|uniref:hypothetical protein n=1 Tax=Nonomuraea sp. NPDC052265 TaxID=3364374 RepID=UPI0037CB0420